MKFSLNDSTGGYVITAYDEGQFKINGKPFAGSQLVFHDRKPEQLELNSIEELSIELIEQLDLDGIDTVLIGTGKKQQFPEDEILFELQRNAVGVEIMDTAAACRTYNILLSEERMVAAVLIAI